MTHLVNRYADIDTDIDSGDEDYIYYDDDFTYDNDRLVAKCKLIVENLMDNIIKEEIDKHCLILYLQNLKEGILKNGLVKHV